jgi:hypothetical protein
MRSCDRIRESFLFASSEMPPASAAFEVSAGEVESIVICQGVASAIILLSAATRLVESGEDFGPEVVDYCREFGNEASLAAATSALGKFPTRPDRPSVLDLGGLCCLAVMSSINAMVTKPGEEVTQLIVNFFSRVRERIVEDLVARSEL